MECGAACHRNPLILQKPSGDRKSVNVQASDNDVATLDDLGLDRRRVAEWRDIRDAGEEVCFTVI